MFQNNNWTLLDFIVEDEKEEYGSKDKNNLSFLKIILSFNDVSIYIPERIKEENGYNIVKYDYDTFIYDLFESFSTYEDIKLQAVKDTRRSTVILNNISLEKDEIIEKLGYTMDLYKLTQKEKYTLLMLITQGVFGLPYNYVLNEYPGYHLGELKSSEKIKGYNRMKIIIYLHCNKQKIIINKKLRLFTVENGDDNTYKILDFTINANILKKKIAFRVKELK